MKIQPSKNEVVLLRVTLVVLLIVAFFAGKKVYEDREFEKLKEYTIRELDFGSRGWCKNFDVVGDFETIRADCDWPMITAPLSYVEFGEANGIKNVCVYLKFNREVGLPMEDIYQVGYKEGNFCGGLLDRGRFDTKAIFSKVNDFLREDLENLKTELCGRDWGLDWGEVQAKCLQE